MVLRDRPVRREISRIGILSRNAQRRITLKNPMSITPYLPDQIRQGNVFTWVNSKWKLASLPGHFSAKIINPRYQLRMFVSLRFGQD